ncbi:hypothetical protein [Nocardioides aurantiacus]|uniref:hypothetical protein n=1 Tax=Nocardioides aurantiacus TaxID=86796 RepID=UPI0011CDF70F|nr:hypothetical protein [Nocardioides aurantiacus]
MFTLTRPPTPEPLNWLQRDAYGTRSAEVAARGAHPSEAIPWIARVSPPGGWPVVDAATTTQETLE